MHFSGLEHQTTYVKLYNINHRQETAKEEKIQQDFLWALGPEATHQITQSENRTEPDNIKLEKLIKLYSR